MTSINAKAETAAKTPDPSLADAPKGKKIGFFAAVALVIGSAIGAGIFFKSGTVLADSGGNLYWAIAAWVVAALTVICMALALLEVAAAAKGNLSIIGWCKAFNRRFVYKGCKYFMTYVYMPAHYFLMAMYVISSLQDSLRGFGVANNFGTGDDWAVWMVVALAITAYFIWVSALPARVASFHNLAIMTVKFFPLVGVVAVGVAAACLPQQANGVAAGGVNNVDGIVWADPRANSLFGLTPGVGLFGSIAAIFFSYDGFYVTSGVQTELKEPKKAPMAVVLGLAVTTFVYLAIAAAVSVSTPGGSFSGLQTWLSERGAGWAFAVMNLLIAVGIFGIINGFAVWGARFIVDLVREGEIAVPKRMLRLLDRPNPVLGAWYMALFALPATVVMSVVGGLAYFPSEAYAVYVDGSLAYSLYDAPGYYTQARLLTFADLMGTWTSLLTISFIAVSIFGGLMNRRSGRVRTDRRKSFVPCGAISFALTSISLALTVAEPFVNIGLLAAHGGLNVPENANRLTGNVLLCVLLVVFAAITFVPVPFEREATIRRLGRLKRLRAVAWWRRKEILATYQGASGARGALRAALRAALGADADLAGELAAMPWGLLLVGGAPFARAHYLGSRADPNLSGERAFDALVGRSLSLRTKAAQNCADTFLGA